MMERRLQTQLDALAQILRRSRRGRALTLCWLAAAALGVAILVLQNLTGFEIHQYTWVLPLAAGGMMAGVVLFRRRNSDEEIRDLLREFERGRTEVRHLLSAATEQKPNEASGAFSYLQLRVIEEALAHP